MARWVSVVEIEAPVGDVWRLIVDWPAHSRWVPMTQVTVLTPLATGVGARFVGRSSLAPLGLDVIGFDDPMEVTEWREPADGVPGRCAVRKLGRVVTGTAAFDVVELPVAPGAPPCTRVVWEEDIEIAPRALTGLASPLVSLAGRLAFTDTLRRMGKELTGPGPAR